LRARVPEVELPHGSPGGARGRAPPLTPLCRWLPSKPEMSRPERTTILDARALSRAPQRMAVEVLELARGTEQLVPSGIPRRAALDELADFGRPERISLCVLVDRGGRELPIQPDIVGKQVKVNSGERVDVLVEEIDGKDLVELVARGRS